jgi:hypothetical protein
MSKQYPGGLIIKNPVVPTSLSAPGIWTLGQQSAAQATNTWPFPRDPQFNYVTMLLHGDGSAGAVAATGVGAGVSTTVTNFNADASTNNFNVTINGDARSDNFTPYQAGYYSNYFGGSGNSINYPSASQYAIGTGNFTLEFFVNFSALNAGHNRMFAIGASGTDGLEIDLNGTNLEVGIQNGYPIGYTWVPTVNTWYYMAVTRSGSTVTLYINGTSVATGTSSNSISQNSLSIGGITWQSTWSINGFLSNVRLSNTVRTIATPTTPYTSDANTLFLGAQSNRFLDNSSYVATATVTGTPQVSPAVPFTLPTTVATYGSGYFDGTTDYLTAPAANIVNFGTGDFEVAAWFNCSSTAAARKIVDNYNGTPNPNIALVVNFNGAGVISWYSGQTALINSSSTFAPNTWNYVVVSRVSGTTRMFLNGTQVGSVSDSNNYAVGFTTVGIGGEPYSSGGTSFLGYLTDVRIVKGSGITSSTVPTAPLTAITNTALLTTQYNGGGNNSGFKDSGPFNFPITRNGNTTQGTFTPYAADWSNYFNGSSGVTVSSTSSQFAFTGDFTWEAWINLNSLPSSGGAISIICSRGANASASAFQFIITNSSGTYRVETTISIGASDSGLVWNIPTAPTVGTWYHVAAVRSGSSVQAYWNGTAIGSAQTASGTTNTPTVSPTVGFRGGSYNDLFLNGYISNLRMVGSAVYTSNFTPSVIPLTAITETRLLTCQSNRFIDNSTNAFTLAVYSVPSVQGFSPFAPLTVYNPATYSGSGYFDGTGDYLTELTATTALNLSSGDWSISFWVYKTATANGSIVNLYNSAGNTSGLSIWIGSGGVKVDNGVSGGVQAGTVVVNAWSYIEVIRSSGTTTIYVNGASAGTTTQTPNASQFGSFGSAADGTLPHQGYVTDLRIVKGTALTSSVPTAPLTAVTGTSLLLNYTNAGILDNAMMNNLETVGNAAVSTSVVKYGTASMYFDGSGDGLNGVISPLFDFGSGSFTVEFWAYCVSTSGTGFFVSCWDNSGGSDANSSWLIRLDSGNVITHFMQGSGTYNTLTSTALSTNTWFHFAWVKNGTTQTMYINGTSVASGTVTGSMNAVIRSLKVGYQGAATNYLNGYIDDLRITKGVARYTANFTAPTEAFPNG